MPATYWQSRPAGGGATAEQKSSGRLAWTIAIVGIVLITASQVLPRWLGRHADHREQGQVTVEEMAEMAQRAEPPPETPVEEPLPATPSP